MKLRPSSATLVLGAFWVALFLMVWTTGAASFIPTPMQTLKALPRLWNEMGLGEALWVSLELNLVAVAIMFVISYSISIATVLPIKVLGYNPFKPLALLVSNGRYNGFVGMPLVFASMFATAHSVKIALLVFGTGTFTVLSLVKLFQGVPKDLFDHSRTLRMNEWRVVWEVVVLGTFDQVIDIMRTNVAMGWMMLPMIEGRYKFEGGVGALMEINAKQFDYPAVFCTLFVILLVGMGQDWLIGVFRNGLSGLKNLWPGVCPYANLGLERE
jgi:NitT/TauT family transport system permease protein